MTKHKIGLGLLAGMDVDIFTVRYGRAGGTSASWN